MVYKSRYMTVQRTHVRNDKKAKAAESTAGGDLDPSR